MIIIDVEASGLSIESYPIEIAWQDSADPDCFDSILIKPAESWDHWDEYAEKEIHHISRKELLSEGILIVEACDRLNTKLSGKTIYSDAIDYDQRWVLRLFNDAGITPNFSLGSIYDVCDDQSLRVFESNIENEYVAHRALADVRQIIRLLLPDC